MSKPAKKVRSRATVYFSYLDPKGFSGQRAATELVINGLAGRGWLCRRLPQPVLDRSDGAKHAKWAYFWGVVGAWLRSLRLFFARGSWLCLNLPQTRTGMLRDAVTLLVARAGLGRSRIAVSLHGSLFMHWPERAFETRLFARVLAQAGTVTVLGERQRARLLQLGVADGSVRVVVNSCELAPLGSAALAEKLASRDGPVRILYLSSLIDTKGYPEFLEALKLLSGSGGGRIEAVLCGKLFNAEQSERFSSSAEAGAWIERTLLEINRRARVSVRWVKGAVGEEKRRLFHEADIFVFPTRYAVEAQPLVLLEAMASGCAIVTTAIGEIPTILDETCASILPAEANSQVVARALEQLIESPMLRRGLARNAHQRFLDRYQIERHIDVWERLLAGGKEAAS